MSASGLKSGCWVPFVLRENLFLEARDSILLRASHETVGRAITYTATLKNNLQPYALRTWILLWVLLAVGSLLLALHRRVLSARRLTALCAAYFSCLYAVCVVLFYAEPLVYPFWFYPS